jgi:oxalate decarboxylase
MTQAHLDNAVSTIRGDKGATVLGPDNVAVGAQNPAAPSTDSGSMPNLKFSFAAAHNRLLDGGWAREVTVRDLPVATTLAGVNMRLKAGAYRELHWHREAEWAFMLAGSARIAAIDPHGRNFIDDIGRGDLPGHRLVLAYAQACVGQKLRGAGIGVREHPGSG